MKKKNVMDEEYRVNLEEISQESLVELNDLLKDRLMKKRESGEISMSMLVKGTGVNEAHLYQWLRGDYQLSRWVTIKKVAHVLGVKIIVKG